MVLWFSVTYEITFQREQITSHEEQVNKLENLLAEHKRSTIPTKGLALQNYKEKEAYLLYEVHDLKQHYSNFF